jgi:hypothetical protein
MILILRPESPGGWHHLNLSHANMRPHSHPQGLTLPQDISNCGQMSDHRAEGPKGQSYRLDRVCVLLSLCLELGNIKEKGWEQIV